MKKKGRLYWITGLSGAGKTTIGNVLYYDLLERETNVVLLDGDLLKSIVGNNLGYSFQERFERAKRYSNLCKLLTDQGMTVIICTIAMFDDVREWNRENIEEYVEVFLDVSMEVLQQRNRKGLYSEYKEGKVKNLAGVDVQIQFPKHPNIIINNDGSKSVEECAKIIENYQVENKRVNCRDVEYWNQYYAQNPMFEPSKFARKILSEMEVKKSVLELGCGNGRDSIFFARSGLDVTAIDSSDVAISNLKKKNDLKIHFICDDFVESRVIYQRQFDYIYSRFTLHALTQKQENSLINNICMSLKKTGKLFIEARTIHDAIYGKGKMVEKNAFIYNDHFRRFIDPEEIKQKLESKGFQITYFCESDEFSPVADEKPMLLRLIATMK